MRDFPLLSVLKHVTNISASTSCDNNSLWQCSFDFLNALNLTAIVGGNKVEMIECLYGEWMEKIFWRVALKSDNCMALYLELRWIWVFQLEKHKRHSSLKLHTKPLIIQHSCCCCLLLTQIVIADTWEWENKKKKFFLMWNFVKNCRKTFWVFPCW